MRLPNGYGSIFKLSGKRRKPWAVRITTGWNDEGQQMYKYLDYFETRPDAIVALAEYNVNPYDLDARKLTVAEVYKKYTHDRYASKDEKTPAGYTAAYGYISKLHDIPFVDIRVPHIQSAIEKCGAGYSTKKNIRILFNLMYKFCMIHDWVDKNYAQLVTLPAQEKSDKHKPFSPNEINALWANTDDVGAKFALIYIYTGLRPTELLKITTDNVFLSERYMLGGMKTAAGKNRIIPIADKIYPFIADLYNPDNQYLAMLNDEHINKYDRLRDRVWQRSKVLQGMDHLPHDGRHTCATLMDAVGIPPVIYQKILGHSGSNITQKVYIHKTVEELLSAINLI